MDFRSILFVWSLVSFFAFKSEALATSFVPRSLRGGSTLRPAASLLQSPTNSNTGEWDISNGSIIHDQTVDAEFVAETNLPTDLGPCRLRAYRIPQSDNEFVGNEPCVIYAADKPPFGKDGSFAEGVPVRVHDQCLTSEVFGSQRCDCKEQLKMSLAYIQANGGAIIYLQQEGRGIGLANKVAAYALQDVGMDTVDANVHLGFAEDCRQYGAIPSILQDMKIQSIKLLTNNPRKVNRLTALGVNVVQTLPMVVKQANPFNRRYLETKVSRMNHTNFGAMLLEQDQIMTFPFRKTGASALNEAVAPSNGVMLPKRHEQQSLSENAPQESDGVTASKDGYCFGRESVEAAIAAVAQGKLVVVVDDMDRENEGDFIMAADLCTPEAMATIVRYSSGVVCIAMEGQRMDELKLPPMVSLNEDPKGTAFSVTVDAVKEKGITTGISATDRSITIRTLASTLTVPTDLARPGHIFPLRAKEGGVLERDGHTEASVDLARLAGRHPSGVLCEIVSEDHPTEMARLPELRRFCQTHGYVLTSIVDLQQYRRDTES